MAKKTKILPIDDLSEIKRRENEKVRQVESHKKYNEAHKGKTESVSEESKEAKKIEAKPEKKDEKQEAKGEEFPVFEIGFDPFKEVK